MASLAAVGYLPNTSFSFRPLKSSSPKDKKPVVLTPRAEDGCAGNSSADASCSSDSGPGAEKAFGRRKVMLVSTIGTISGCFLRAQVDGMSMAAEFADMPALRGKDYGKSKMRYPDYTETQSGLQYKDLRLGDGPTPKMGETVVVDWDGYTIGYYGRIFEARNKTKGGSFEGEDKDFFKFKLGSNQVIPAFEEAISGMALGGIRSNAGS